MSRPRSITVQLARDPAGLWIATVPSLGVSVSGATSEEALTQVRSLATRPTSAGGRISDPGGRAA